MLAVDAVEAGYGLVNILKGISIKVANGEAVAIIGANGAGKSTLVRAICGLNIPTAGRILMDDRDITLVAPHDRVRHGLAVVLENRRLFGELTVRENLRLAERAGRRVDAGAISFSWQDVVDLFPIIDEKKSVAVELLSGGQQQMVAIARALLLQPNLLILDEPSTGLAPKIVEDILTIIGKLRMKGMALLIAEQDVHIATTIAERGYVMSLGEIALELSGTEWKQIKSDQRLARAYLSGH